MADNTEQTAATGEHVEWASAAGIETEDLPLGVQPSTASHVREPCEKDDRLPMNPQAMEDDRKALEKKNREQAAAGSGQQEGDGNQGEGGHQEGRGDGNSGATKANVTP